MSSEMNNELFSKKGRLQDGYSFRCVCQIHGIVLETIEKTKKIVNRELNCVSTRPLVYPTDKDIVINGESFESLEGIFV